TIAVPRDMIWAVCGLMAFTPFVVIMLPASWRVTPLVLAGMAAAGAAGMLATPGGLVAAGIYVAFVAGLGVVRAFNARLAFAEASREFSFRARIAPAHVVRHALGSGEELDTVFRPTVKQCVCISS